MESILRFPPPDKPSGLLPAALSLNGFRTSGPRHRRFVQTCKNRWKGKTLYECFASEHSSRPPQYYQAMIDAGLLRAVKFGTANLDLEENGNREGELKEDSVKTPDRKRRRLSSSLLLTGCESIIHESILTEAVVPTPQIKVVAIENGFLVADKPAGVPCYPQGPFESNTLQHLLEGDEELQKTLHEKVSIEALHCHFVSRLDRVTGGLVAVAFSGGAECAGISKAVAQWKKAYLACVRGDFRKIDLEAPYVKRVSLPNGHTAVICEAPLEKLQHEPGTALKVRVSSDLGKESRSIFIGIQSDESSSIVMGFPITGRTHQLRCHLQYLQHPIVGDSLYDEEALKDTKEHDMYIVCRYTASVSATMLEAVPISRYLDTETDLGNLEELHWDHAPYPALIEKVFVARGSQLARRDHVFPDLSLGPGGHIMSYHPFVDPWQIPLHACIYLREEGEEPIAVQSLPDFARHVGSISNLIAIARLVAAHLS